MKSPPDSLAESDLVRALAEGWGIDVARADYAPVGGGSHHWIVTDADGIRWFVTVDDLDQKPWFGIRRDQALNGLMSAYATAIALARAGLEFVAAPIPTRRGEPLRPVSERYSVAAFPFLEGVPGQFGEFNDAERTAIPVLLARLHGATGLVASTAPRLSLEIPGRASLDEMLGRLATRWTGGPFSEVAREMLTAAATKVHALLHRADRLADGMARANTDWVLTHGEPHGGNVMRTAHGFLLIDWDTAAIAPRERDLWMLLTWSDSDGSAYSAATGAEIDRAAIEYFRLRWDLSDIAAFADLLRQPHRETEDTARALENLRWYLGGSEAAR